MQIGSYQEILGEEQSSAPSSGDYLDRFKSLHPRSVDLSLDRINRILTELGNPERSLPPVVHVAGTNGKGSTIAFLRAMAEAAGKRAHAYISPHLVNFHERIILANHWGAVPISEAYLVDCLARAEAANAHKEITFFEITTAAAFLAFSERNADFLLLECGLGGRLDATNVVAAPHVTVITPISIDHVAFLGDTVAKIAEQKAGILKPGVPCVVGRQDPVALDVIKKRAATIGSPLHVCGRDFDVSSFDEHLVYECDDDRFELPLPSLRGVHQIENAGTAIATARFLLRRSLSRSVIRRGLTNARWPARLQRLRKGSLSACVRDGCQLIVDGAHNPGGARVIASALDEMGDPSHRWVIILGMMNSKEANVFIAAFKGRVSRLYTVAIPDEPESFSAEELAQIARNEGFDAIAVRNVVHGLFLSQLNEDKPQQILICGSLYLAGHVLRLHYGPAGSNS